jgi:ketopantoate reductase
MLPLVEQSRKGQRHLGQRTMASEKANILIIGMGGVGTMAAYALETGGGASVTAVLRSNYAAVEKHGFDIDSIDYGHDIKGFRPTTSEQNAPAPPLTIGPC